jgi:hypothetical protein
MKRIPVALSACAGLSVLLAVAACTTKPPPGRAAPMVAGLAAPRLVAPAPACDASLWQHVYAGDPRKFDKPQDRLQVIKDCVTVSGTIMSAVAEADGDWHVRLRLDPEFADMTNAKNESGQGGNLVLEPVCSNPVKQRDTIDEGSCDGFSQRIFDKSMTGQHVRVSGAYVTDMEHGWNEIHPVTSITPTGE